MEKKYASCPHFCFSFFTNLYINSPNEITVYRSGISARCHIGTVVKVDCLMKKLLPYYKEGLHKQVEECG